MKHSLYFLVGAALLALLFTAGCAQQSMSRDEGGIVGSGSKPDCQQQPKPVGCGSHVQ